VFIIRDIYCATDSTTVDVAFSVLNLTLVDSLHNFIVREGFFWEYFDGSLTLGRILFSVLLHNLYTLCGYFATYVWQLCNQPEKHGFDADLSDVIQLFSKVPENDHSGKSHNYDFDRTVGAECFVQTQDKFLAILAGLLG
jgi:hypothetical protein